MRSSVLCALILLSISACGGSGSTTIGYDPNIEAPTTLISADGRITAVIPSAAVDAEVRFTLANRSSSDAGVPGPAERHLVMAMEFSAVALPQPEPENPGAGVAASQAAEEPDLPPVELLASVDITFQLVEALPAATSLPLYIFNENSQRYEEAGLSGRVSDDGTEFTFSISEFGCFAFYSLLASELPPAAPTGLILLTASTQVRKLSWSAVAGADIAGYNLYRSPEGQEGFSKVNQAALTTTIYSDELPAPGTFRYQVTTLGANDLESEPSNIVLSPAVDFDLYFTFGDDVLAQPMALALNSAQQRLVVADQALGRLSIYDLEGHLVRHISRYGSYVADDPLGLAFSPDGEWLYVTDAEYGVCFILDASYAVVGAFGNPGDMEGQFRRPTGVVAIGDRVLVADAQRSDIQAFTPLGVYLELVAGPGTATGLLAAPEMLLARNEGGLLVADSGNNRVQALADDNTFENLIELLVEDDGPMDAPLGLALDFRGRLYVSDSGNRRVVVFDDGSEFAFHFGAHGSRVIEFSPTTGPAGMALDRSTGYLYVCDPGNHRIAVFKT